MSFELQRFPEWKTLYDQILPRILGGEKEFSYDILSEMAKIDVQTGRGRAQFYRCRQEILKKHQLWMENISGSGYEVIPAKDQSKSAYKRVGQARRKVKMAGDINANVKMEELTPAQQMYQAQMSVLLHNLSKTFHAVGRKLAIASAEAKLPVDIKMLAASINGKPEEPEK